MVARALNGMGLFLGNPSQLLPPAPDNTEGFWEHKDVVAIHNRLLQAFGRTWDKVLPLPIRWLSSPTIQIYKQELQEIILRETAEVPVWGFKDPRTCLLIPLWKEICSELGISLEFVIPWRHPLEVSASLHKRDGFSYEKGFSLWYLYTLLSLYETATYPRIFVRYETMLENPERESMRLARHLDLFASLDGRAHELIRPDLRHHDVSAQIDLSMPAKVRTLFDLLSAGNPNDAAHQQTVQRLYAEYMQHGEVTIDEPSPSQVQLFYSPTQTYSESLSITMPASPGIERTLEFGIPKPGVVSLRLDPANTPAVIHIKCLEIHYTNPDEDKLTRRFCTRSEFEQLSLANLELVSTEQSIQLVACTADPQVFIPVPAGYFPRSVTLTMLLRTDSEAIAQACQNILHVFEQSHDRNLMQEQRLADTLNEYAKQQAAHQAQIAHWTTLLEAKNRECQEISQEARRMAQQIADLAHTVDLLQHSRSWRLTKPLRSLGAWMRNLSSRSKPR